MAKSKTKTITDQVRDGIRESGFLQAEVARAAGVSESTVSRIASGLTAGDAASLSRLLTALGYRLVRTPQWRVKLNHAVQADRERRAKEAVA